MGNDGLHGFSYVDTPVGVPFADEAAMTIPKVATFPTWRSGNGGTAVIADLASGLGVRITCLIPAGVDPSLTYAAVPVVVGSGGWQVTARILGYVGPTTYGSDGIILRDAASGKSVLFGRYAQDEAANWGFQKLQFSDDDTYDGRYGMAAWHEQRYWLRVKDDLTNWTIYCSTDGTFWQQIYREARNDYLGTTPTHVGIHMNPNYQAGGAWGVVTGMPVAMDCFSFLFETL